MRSDPADLALRNLERLVARDPILRDIVNPTLPAARRAARLVPPVDVLEGPDGWTLLVELPGVPRDTLRVRLDGTRLTVSGEKPKIPGSQPGSPARREGAAPRVAERDTGAFTREFLVPFQVRPERIEAKLEDGVLTIVLPRTGADGARDITVG